MALEETSRPERSLSRLIELARAVRMSDSQEAEQRNSFVYGNTRIENASVTFEMVKAIATSLATRGQEA